MTKDRKHIDNLIARYLAGEITPGEELVLWEWIDNAPENKKYFEDFQYVHDKSSVAHRYVRLDVDKAWDVLSGKMDNIQTNKNVAESKTRILSNPWIRIAASVIILLGISLLMYRHFSRSPEILRAETITSNDSIMNVSLSQNTQIVLNKNTQVNYKATRNSRKIKLSGEAFIKVKHSVKSPLIVEAGGTLIEDIGTAFNVKVYVDSGAVKFYTQQNQGIIISAGKTGVYRKDTKLFTINTYEDPNTIAYKTKIFVFQKTRLIEAVEQLNAVYSKTIILGNPALADCPITVSFDREELNTIVDIIAETMGLQVVKTPEGFTLNGEQCNSR